jgi:tetratricopeptide (TPR) repeat protein
MAKRSKKKKKPSEVSQVRVAEVKEILSRKGPGVPWPPIIQALIIVAAVLWIYGPVLHGDWLWDDGKLVANNELVHDPSGLWKIWFQPGSLFDYQPLKVSVVWLQWQLWGDNLLGYHLTNVFLHTLSALLVWRLFSKFGLPLAWLGGLIFAIHPVQVESVAWISELKNTLSLPPFLLAMCAWIDFEEHGKKSDYFLALGLFLAAMLCKPAMVMFPVVILLYAWWKRGRIRWNDVKAGTPFFVVSLVLGLITIWFLHHIALGNESIQMGGFFSRLACAGLSLSFYFSKCFLPVGLLPVYPRWVVDPPTPTQFLPGPILLAAISWLWTKRKNWGRHALLGLGFFLINLAPFLGFNEGAYMDFTWVMDHILYIPMLGLTGLVVAALGQVKEHLSAPLRLCGAGLVTVVLALLAFKSHTYAKIFINSVTLWTYDLKYNPESYQTHGHLGLDLLQKGRLPEAMAQLDQALRINPDDAEYCFYLATHLLQSGQVPEAIELYQKALKIKPDYADAHTDLGFALLQTGRVSEAMEQFEQVLQIKPDDFMAHNNLGSIFFNTGRFPEAIEQFEQAMRIKPDSADAHYNLGNALVQTGRISEAIEQYQQALQLRPDFDTARHNLEQAQALQESAPAKN